MQGNSSAAQGLWLNLRDLGCSLAVNWKWRGGCGRGQDWSELWGCWRVKDRVQSGWQLQPLRERPHDEESPSSVAEVAWWSWPLTHTLILVYGDPLVLPPYSSLPPSALPFLHLTSDSLDHWKKPPMLCLGNRSTVQGWRWHPTGQASHREAATCGRGVLKCSTQDKWNANILLKLENRGTL